MALANDTCFVRLLNRDAREITDRLDLEDGVTSFGGLAYDKNHVVYGSASGTVHPVDFGYRYVLRLEVVENI